MVDDKRGRNALLIDAPGAGEWRGRTGVTEVIGPDGQEIGTRGGAEAGGIVVIQPDTEILEWL